jgi:hypothetical protein
MATKEQQLTLSTYQRLMIIIIIIIIIINNNNNNNKVVWKITVTSYILIEQF